MAETSSAIFVAVRLRPLSERERQEEQQDSWAIDSNSIALRANPAGTLFTFDQLYGPEVRENRVIFEALAKPIIDSALMGFNGTIFAYGQTSAGKTYTMKGEEGNLGLVPLSLEYMFQAIRQWPGREFNLRCAYLEIYNEVISDLLAPGNTNLKVHESLASGVFVGNMTDEPVASFEEALGLFASGDAHRQTGATNVNEQSSRSHTMLRLTIESRESEAGGATRDSFNPGPLKVSTLNFVDLAGSERVGLTGAEGLRLKEGGHINKSLFALTSVISKLSDGNDRSHIPYRDSKLTRILQSSLGGNAKTAILCALTPASQFCDESMSTLKFASRAKKIRNRPHINEYISDKDQIGRYRDEIAQLQRTVESLQQNPKRRKYDQDDLDSIRAIHLELKRTVEDLNSRDVYPEKVMNALNELWDEISFLRIEASASSRALQEHLVRSGELEAQVHELTDQRAVLTEENGRLAKSRERVEELESKLKETFDEMASVEEALMDDMARLSAENESLTHRLQGAEDRLRAPGCIGCDQVSEQIDAFSASLQELEEELRRAPKQADIESMEIAHAKRLDVLNQEKEEAMAAADNLRAQIGQRDRDLSEMMSHVASAKNTERAAEVEYENQIQNLQYTISKLEDDRQRLELELARVGGELSELQGVRTGLDASLGAKQAEVDDLHSERQRLEASVRQAGEDLSGAQEALCSKLETETRLVGQVVDLQRQLLDSNAVIDGYREQSGVAKVQELLVKGLQECLVTEQAVQGALQEKLSKALSELEIARLAATAKANSQTTLEAANDALAAQLSAAGLELSDLRAKAAGYEGRLAEFEGERNDAVGRLDADLASRESQIRSVSEQLCIAKDTNAALLTEKERIAGLLDRSNTQKQELEAAIFDMQANESVLSGALAKAQQELSAAKLASQDPGLRSTEVLLRIELEKLKETFQKERRLLNLQISELEDKSDAHNDRIDLLAKVKRLEEENFRVSQLHQAGIHKIDYLTKLINSKSPSDAKENAFPKDQAFGK